MSKQYLTTHTIEDAHPTDIFSIATTSSCVITASGSSSLKVYSTLSSDFPLIQTLEGVHKLGCHHVAASGDGKKAASVGFGGEVKLWANDGEDGQGKWVEDGKLAENNKAGEIWAIALSSDGQYLTSTTHDGRINVWDLAAADKPKIHQFETKGSFGMCIDMSTDGTLTASGHQSGSLFIFSNTTRRLLHSLPSLLKPIRSVRFSPSVTLLAAAGDASVIALYDVTSGEQVAALSGHGGSWIFGLDWSLTGEWLGSSAWDGKVKVWRTETRECVATLREQGGKCVWDVRWLRGEGVRGIEAGRRKGEGFVTGGASRAVSFYREAAGG